jgi:hypothetical protein
MPVSDVRKGMTGKGWTVVSGQRPQPFNVEVLGVLQNGIDPGRDMIVVDTSPASNPSPIIDAHGGIWFGMSGSPVYVGGKLLGAVAFGLSFGASSIAGVTPAQDMLSILDYGSPAAPGTTTSARAATRRISVPRALRQTIATTTGSSTGDVGGSFVQLKMPLSISGLSPSRVKKLAGILAKRNLPLIPYSGSSAPAPSAASGGVLRPGGNFAAALSYGDITFAGVGTTTYVCNGRALAFGHPFAWTGPTEMGASPGDALTVVNDPLFGGFKLANVGAAVGTVDQDRLAGIRADFARLPQTIPVRSSTTALDWNRSRVGETEVTTSEFVPDITFVHIFSNIDSTFDEIGPGSSSLAWTITGTTASGKSWQLKRSNMYTSQYDISFGSVFEIAGELYTLLHNKFEKVTFTAVNVATKVQQAIRQYKIVKVLVSRNGGAYKSVKRLLVHRGDHLGVRVALTPYVGGGTRTVDLKVQVPWSAKGGAALTVAGGSSGVGFCFFGGCGGPSGSATSVEGLVSKLESAPHNNDLVARLQRGRVTTSRGIATLDQVVVGFRSIPVEVVCC